FDCVGLQRVHRAGGRIYCQQADQPTENDVTEVPAVHCAAHLDFTGLEAVFGETHGVNLGFEIAAAFLERDRHRRGARMNRSSTLVDDADVGGIGDAG